MTVDNIFALSCIVGGLALALEILIAICIFETKPITVAAIPTCILAGALIIALLVVSFNLETAEDNARYKEALLENQKIESKINQTIANLGYEDTMQLSENTVLSFPIQYPELASDSVIQGLLQTYRNNCDILEKLEEENEK